MGEHKARKDFLKYYQNVLKQGYIEGARGHIPLDEDEIAYIHKEMKRLEDELRG